MAEDIPPPPPGEVLKFDQFVSGVKVPFWQQLAKRKLDEYGLSDAPQPIHATFGVARARGEPSRIILTEDAFEPYDG